MSYSIKAGLISLALVSSAFGSTSLGTFETSVGLAKTDVVIRKQLDRYVQGLIDGIYITNLYSDEKLFCAPALDHAKFYSMLTDEIDKKRSIYIQTDATMPHIALWTVIRRFPCN